MNLTGIVQQLRKERRRAQAEVNRLDAAITALGGVGRSGVRNGRRRKGTRKLSAAARARISAAQKARWAKWKAKRKM